MTYNVLSRTLSLYTTRCCFSYYTGLCCETH